MAEEAKRKVRAELRNAQDAFERAEVQREKVSTARRESFEKEQATGLTLREIGEVVGLHHTRVGEILRGE
jgi:ribonuclease PH